jgi:hypothetical protein
MISKSSIAVVLFLLCTIWVPNSAAYGSSNQDTDVETSLLRLTNLSTSPPTAVLEQVAEVPTDESGSLAIDAVIGDVRVSVPTDARDLVKLDAENGANVEIGLPFSSTASSAMKVRSGVVAFNNNNESSTALVVKNDGSVQITSIIQNAAAPTIYPFELTIPEGMFLELLQDRSVVIRSHQGSVLGGFAPAWAKDARGVAVSTRYELEGSTLVQIVNHTEAEYQYPIIADPWLGLDLVEKTTWVGSTLQVYPTWWARFGAGWGARWSAWDEVLAKTPGSRENTPSMRDQLYCHFDFVRFRAPNKPSWNLDAGRPYVAYEVLVFNLCNA